MILLFAVALSASAQIEWVAPNDAAAISAARIDANARVCRARVNGNTYIGQTVAAGSTTACRVTDGTTATNIDSHEILIMGGRWDFPGESNAVIGGSIGGVGLFVCRGTRDGQRFGGWTSDVNGPCRVADGLPIPAGSFELLYPFDGSSHMLISRNPVLRANRDFCIQRADQLAAIQLCGVQTLPLQLISSGRGAYKIRVFPPLFDQCITAGNPRFVSCASATAFQLEWVNGTVFRLRTPGGNAMRTVPAAFGIFLLQNGTFTGTGDENFEIRPFSSVARDFKMITYNMMFLPKSIDVIGIPVPILIFPELAQEFRASEIAKKIDDFDGVMDVIAVQEAFSDSGRKELEERLKERGYNYYSKIPDASLSPSNGGVFLASRWPIETTSGWPFVEPGSGFDFFSAKGVSYALINKLGKRYHVFTTHLQADDVPKALRQVNEIRSRINQVVGSNPARDVVLIAGDMNIDMEGDPSNYNEMLSRLNAVFPNPPRPVGVPSGPVQFRWTADSTTNDIKQARDSSLSQSFLDYIFVEQSGALPLSARWLVREYETSPRFEMAVKPYNPTKSQHNDLSDHSAVIGFFRFPSSQASSGPATVPLRILATLDGSDIPVQITLDGQPQTTPLELQLNNGQPYEITAPEFLQNQNGCRQRFDKWSNGGVRQLVFTGSDKLDKLTAEYVSECEITGVVRPSGAGVLDGPGWYKERTNVPMSTAVNPGYKFSRYTVTENGRSIDFTDNPFFLRANNRLIAVTATLTQTVNFATNVPIAGASVTINGNTQPMPFEANLNPDQPYTFSVPEIIPAGAGARYRFTGWNNSPNRTQTLSVPFPASTMVASYVLEYEVQTSVSPVGAGTVTPGGWFAAASSLTITAAAAQNFQFSNFSGSLTRTENPLVIPVNGPLNIVANFAPTGLPTLFAITGARTDDPVSGARLVTLALRNTSQFAAINARITGISGVRVTAGTGTVGLGAVAFPLNVGNLAALTGNGSVSVPFSWPATATRIQFTVQFAADGGYTGSTTLNVIR